MQPSHLCAAIHKLMCAGIPPPPLWMRKSPLFFHCKTSAGGSDKYTLNFDCDVRIAISLSLCFLCEVMGFSRDRFKTSSLCDSFITACHWTDGGLYWVCGWLVWCVYVGVGNKTGINVTMVERSAMIWIWLYCLHQHKLDFVASHYVYCEDQHNLQCADVIDELFFSRILKTSEHTAFKSHSLETWEKMYMLSFELQR